MKLISIISLSLFFFYSSNFRPSLTRAETIESCNSDDLVTVLEMHNRKPYKIIDRKREVKKGVMAETLDELVNRGKILPQLDFVLAASTFLWFTLGLTQKTLVFRRHE